MTQEKLRSEFEKWAESDEDALSGANEFQIGQQVWNVALQKAEVAIIEEIVTSTGPTGGWLDSPKAIAAALTQRIRKLME